MSGRNQQMNHLTAKNLLLILSCCLIVATFGCRTTTARITEPTSSIFGVIESYESAESATELGVGWTRLNFHWNEIQQHNADEWEFEREQAIDQEVAQGRELVGLLLGIPQWARDEQDLPKGLYLPIDDPQNLWANFVRFVVKRYIGRIDHWIIWNEPDIWDDTALGFTWHGTEKDFAQLLRVAYLVAKEENPQATIHLSAMTFFWDNNFGRTQYLDRLLTELEKDPQAAKHNFYFDVATAHLYFQPAQIMTVLQIWQDIFKAHQLEKKFWLIETNAPPSRDPQHPAQSVTFEITLEEQAAYLPQAAAIALASQVERVGVYKLKDIASDQFANPEPFGLVRLDGSRRPAFDSYQHTIKMLDGELISGKIQRWDEVGQIELTYKDRIVTVAFSRRPIPQMITIDSAEPPQLFDMWQKSYPSTQQGNQYQVELPPASCTQWIGVDCMIGGNVIYRVQSR